MTHKETLRAGGCVHFVLFCFFFQQGNKESGRVDFIAYPATVEWRAESRDRLHRDLHEVSWERPLAGTFASLVCEGIELQ